MTRTVKSPKKTGKVTRGQAREAVKTAAQRGADDTDRMMRIDDLIAELQKTSDQFGNTCVYIRRGGLSWGAVALNYRADDEKHGVFDLQAQHDRDMIQKAEQVERLLERSRRWQEDGMVLVSREPVAWLRDLDGTGSLHACSEGDPGAIPVARIEETST